MGAGHLSPLTWLFHTGVETSDQQNVDDCPAIPLHHVLPQCSAPHLLHGTPHQADFGKVHALERVMVLTSLY